MTQWTLLNLQPSKKSGLLENILWMNDLTKEQMNVLSPYFKDFLAPASTIILQRKGTSHDFFCIACDGIVDVVKSNFSEEPKKILSLGAGKVFGEISFFDGGACSASIIAKSNVTLLVMDKVHFEKLCVDHPRISLKLTINLLKGITQRLRQTTGRLIDLL